MMPLRAGLRLPTRGPLCDAPRVFRLALLAYAILLLVSRPARAQCEPVKPLPCADCFAVFVMPDTQGYTDAVTQPAGANHLDLVTRYVCDHRTAWTEPTTGKTMPLLMVIQLGDLVQHPDRQESGGPPLTEWTRVSAAFANLDACTPKVPYLVTAGNHDLSQSNYERPSVGYETFFGPDRWASQGVACSSLQDCDWAAGQYFLGAGDTIVAGSRNNQNGDGGSPGPATDQVGRHRAGLIRAPNGQPFLFLGLEMAFDFPPPAAGSEGVERDDSAWPKRVLAAYPAVPTVVFHHSMLWAFPPPDTRVRWGPETWHSDSITPTPGDYATDPDFGTTGGMQDLFDLLIDPYPQVRFLFTGHVFNPTHQADYTIPRKAGPPVWAFLRNFQTVDLGLPGDGDLYGVGWNVVAVFDPAAEQVRVRSYRIDDEAAYATPPTNLLHTGTPVPTECMETDQGGVGERIVPWSFSAAGAATPALSTSGAAGLAAVVSGSTAWILRRRSRSP